MAVELALPPFAEFGRAITSLGAEGGILRLAVGAPGVPPAGRVYVLSLDLGTLRRAARSTARGAAAHWRRRRTAASRPARACCK